MDTGAFDRGVYAPVGGKELEALKHRAWGIFVKCMTLFVARRNSAIVAED
jgi:hypothetical protein